PARDGDAPDRAAGHHARRRVGRQPGRRRGRPAPAAVRPPDARDARRRARRRARPLRHPCRHPSGHARPRRRPLRTDAARLNPSLTRRRGVRMAVMERMAGIDAGFLAMETPSQHMHTLKIAILDVSRVPGGYSFERFRDVLGARLDRLPPFRRRIVEVPGRLNHPVWIADPGFDLDAHLQRVVLPSPGTRAQLDDVVSSIASRPLPRDRPLWEVSVVEGLADGTVPFVAKLHHCIADGVTAAELLVGVLDRDPEAPDRPEDGDAPGWRAEPVPSRVRLVVDALVDALRALAGLPDLIARTVRGLVNVARGRRARAASAPLPFATPKLRFNRALTPRRRFVSTTLPLADVKTLKQALGCTVNDVVLALCTGALRRYLLARGELPDRALVASVPVSTRAPASAPTSAANNVSNLFTTLPVHVDDPHARLAEIHAVTQAAKDQ